MLCTYDPLTPLLLCQSSKTIPKDSKTMAGPLIERLWLTEKPDMAKNLVAGLILLYPGTTVANHNSFRTDGCFKLSNGDVVTYLFGHMLELAPPEHYLTETQNNGDVFDYLPFCLDQNTIHKIPKPEIDKNGNVRVGNDGKHVMSRQLYLLRNMIRNAKTIVNAGDTDREGQLIMDELMLFCGVDPSGNNIKRLSLESPKKEDIAALIEKGLEANNDEKWRRRFLAALVREICDWNLGMTASRAFQQVTGYRRMSVGRVTTPTLHIVVQRELEIEGFTPTQYYVPHVTLNDGIRLRWHQREGAEGTTGFDKDGRIVSEQLANEIVQRIRGGLAGTVVTAEAKILCENPPLPFDLSSLQSHVARTLRVTLKEAEALIKALYEKHKMISYIGTDCRYLPTSMHADAPKIVAGIAAVSPTAAKGCDFSLKSAAFDDAKLDEHHAIIPTGVFSPTINEDELAVFEIVAKRYMAQFYPAHEYLQVSLHVRFGKDEFRTSERITQNAGWKEAFAGDEVAEDEEDAAQKGKEPAVAIKITPHDVQTKYRVGAGVQVKAISLDSGVTKPPKRFTEDTLLDELTQAHKYATTEEHKAILRSIKGLGTARTRANIIDGQIARRLIERVREGRKVVLMPTPGGRKVVQHLPPFLLSVAVTAGWEYAFRQIEKMGTDLSILMPSIQNKMTQMLQAVVQDAKSKGSLNIYFGNHEDEEMRDMRFNHAASNGGKGASS